MVGEQGRVYRPCSATLRTPGCPPLRDPWCFTAVASGLNLNIPSADELFRELPCRKRSPAPPLSFSLSLSLTVCLSSSPYSSPLERTADGSFCYELLFHWDPGSERGEGTL